MSRRIPYILAAIMLCVGSGALNASAQKYGGTLRGMMSTNPPSLSIHDEATPFTQWPMMPVYNNLVLFDPLVAQETLASIIPELASTWRWSSDKKNLTFTLRRGVRFHDGKPFSSKDVKHTFDVVRGVSQLKTKLSPRKLWYFNVTDIVTNGDHEVTFKLKRPQPSLLVMLATGFAPIYPAHIHPRELRIKAVGTGPFRLVEYKRDQSIHVKKNADYFIKRRPFLDAIRYSIIRKAGARIAAMAAKQVDVDMPHITTKPVYNSLKAAVAGLAFIPITRFSFQNVIFNPNKPPFNDVRLRQVVSMALDRNAFSKGVYQGGVVPGGIMLTPPSGAWGLPADQLAVLPGYGDAAKNRAEARRIMASLGYGPDKPLKVTLITRALKTYTDAAVWTLGELHKVWIEGELKQIESGVWYGTVARRDYTIAVNSTGVAADDPDVAFYENYACGSQRNYSDYCNPEAQKLYDQQSQEFDPEKRLKLVREIDKKLVRDVARIVFGFRINYNARWPYVKNLVPHQTSYSTGRMQEVWLDR